MKIQIKCCISNKVLFEHDAENNTMRLTLEAAVVARANLARANLEGADLTWANLAGANLARANLAGAYLEGAYLDGEKLTKAPLSLINLHWNVLITGQYMRIGCQHHTHEQWAAFSDDDISAMASEALDFWRRWKIPLLALCEQHLK